jgi:hypothetical protein
VTEEPIDGAGLADGSYDVLVVDADGPDDAGVVHLELTLVAGPHKGELVTVAAAGLGRDGLDLLAVPATLTVAAGIPTVHLEG